MLTLKDLLMANDDSTVVLTDIHKALASSDREAQDKPAALVVVGGDLNGTLFDLVDVETVAGRSPDNLIALEFNGISRMHFKIISYDENVKHTVEDCGSKNGTFVNNQQISGAHNLQKGDIIKVGNIAMKYLPKGDPERLT